jgi:predicted P-loop ATPase
VIHVQGVDLAWVRDNRDRIWGSAMAAYRRGERWWYTAEEGALVSAQATAFAAEDPLRDAIEAWAEDHPEVVETCSVRILMDLDYADQLRDQQLRLKAGNALTALGWRRTQEKRRYWLRSGKRTDRTYGWIRPGDVPPNVPA